VARRRAARKQGSFSTRFVPPAGSRSILAQLPDLQSDFTPELACVAAQVFDFA
jgi:hypothetical protein